MSNIEEFYVFLIGIERNKKKSSAARSIVRDLSGTGQNGRPGDYPVIGIRENVIFEKPSVTNRKKMMRAIYVQQLHCAEE